MYEKRCGLATIDRFILHYNRSFTENSDYIYNEIEIDDTKFLGHQRLIFHQGIMMVWSKRNDIRMRNVVRALSYLRQILRYFIRSNVNESNYKLATSRLKRQQGILNLFLLKNFVVFGTFPL
jgi:hypothetical protein